MNTGMTAVLIIFFRELSMGPDPTRPARKRPLATKKAADKPNPLEVEALEARARELRAANDRIGELRAYASLGQLCDQHGRPGLAHEYFRQSLAVATEIGHAKGMMDAHHKLAVLHFTRKKYALAVPHYLKVVALAREERNADKLRRCYHELASCETLQGNRSEAAGWLESYLGTLSPNDDQDAHCKFTAHRRLADLHTALGNPDAAGAHHAAAERFASRMAAAAAEAQAAAAAAARPLESGDEDSEPSRTATGDDEET
jgi:hypothetical protein